MIFMPTLFAHAHHGLGSLVAIFGLPGGGEWIILLILGLLIFGRRLPEVGRSLGKGIVEFKKGIKGVEDEVDEEVSRPAKRVTDQPRSELPKARAREEMDSEYAATPAPAPDAPHKD
jgi:sec-independent protein translocase protein TatA